MLNYHVAGIAFDKNSDRQPWKWHCNENFNSVEEALECIDKMKDKLNLICSWIILGGNNRTVVFHETYIDIFGYDRISLDSDVMELRKEENND